MWWRLDGREDRVRLWSERGRYEVPALAGRDRSGTLYAGDEALENVYRIRAESAFPEDIPGAYSQQVLMGLFEKAGLSQGWLGPGIEVVVSSHNREKAEQAWREVLSKLGVRKIRFQVRSELAKGTGDGLVADLGQAFSEYTLYEKGKRKACVTGPGLNSLDRRIAMLAGSSCRCLIHDVDVRALRQAATGKERTIWINGMNHHGKMVRVGVEEAALRPLFASFAKETAECIRPLYDGRVSLLGNCWLLEEEGGIPFERMDIYG